MKNELKSNILKKKYRFEPNKIIKAALYEDVKYGDITSAILIPNSSKSEAKIIAKEDGVLCGIDIVKKCFITVDKKIKFKKYKEDGAHIKKNDIICHIEGSTKNILKAERTALNFLQLLSGISTYTNKVVSIAKKYNVIILDTRKTTPGLRMLQKYAVSIGGGRNHRFNLSDEILIKENHILANDGIENTLRKLKTKYKNKFEIEVETMDEFKSAIMYNAPIILLDNFSIRNLKKAVALNKGKALLEASGGITLKNISKVAKTGVDYISIGATTHSVKALDFSLQIIEK